MVDVLRKQVRFLAVSKGQLILKADWHAIDSPKKRTDDLFFFFLLFYSSRQTNQIRPFVFWENLWRANLLFGFILPLPDASKHS